MEKNRLLYEVFPGGLRDIVVSRIEKGLKDDIVDGELIIDRNQSYSDTLMKRLPAPKNGKRYKIKWYIDISVVSEDD